MMTPDEFFGALENMPQPQPVFYRLYHDTQGYPLFYSMEDLPGTYIELTQEQYACGSSNVRVRDGRLIPVTWHTAHKLTPVDHTGTQCHINDVAVVVDSGDTYWSKKTYES